MARPRAADDFTVIRASMESYGASAPVGRNTRRPRFLPGDDVRHGLRACCKLLALTARRAWRSTLSPRPDPQRRPSGYGSHACVCLARHDTRAYTKTCNLDAD